MSYRWVYPLATNLSLYLSILPSAFNFTVNTQRHPTVFFPAGLGTISQVEFSKNCSATVGQVGNVGVNQKSLGKAGSKCWLGKRPVVRGVVMNPVDHPHGGGEGRAPIGRKKPATPWGYPALGRRSRKRNKYSDNLILRRRSK